MTKIGLKDSSSLILTRLLSMNALSEACCAILLVHTDLKYYVVVSDFINPNRD